MERVVLNKLESIERCIKRIKEINAEGDLEEFLYQDAIVLNLPNLAEKASLMLMGGDESAILIFNRLEN